MAIEFHNKGVLGVFEWSKEEIKFLRFGDESYFGFFYATWLVFISSYVSLKISF